MNELKGKGHAYDIIKPINQIAFKWPFLTPAAITDVEFVIRFFLCFVEWTNF